MKKTLIVLFCWVGSFCASAQQHLTEHVFLITTDGFRWQELYGGADSSLLFDRTFTKDSANTVKTFWAETPQQRRTKLMPFFWNTIAQQGQLYGNRWLGNKVNVLNPYWFSYPGYSEILTGFVDESINSNDKKDNPNVTVLEFLHRQKGFQGQIAAFASWDVFPWIIHTNRSGIPVNAGVTPAQQGKLSERELYLNELLPNLPSPWGTSARLDLLTYQYAKEYVKRASPKVLFLAFDETDDYAHDGNYRDYLSAAHRVDSYIADLWNYVQSQPKYRNKTTFIITTDHGRGFQPKVRWKDHGTKTPNSYEIWFAVIGPDTPPTGEVSTSAQYFQNQLAKTLAAFLGIDYQNKQPVGEVVSGAIKK
ncbi:MAG: phosphoglyceromutase [Spirosomataceae bacterium]